MLTLLLDLLAGATESTASGGRAVSSLAEPVGPGKVYEAIIGARVSEIAASKALSERGHLHLILEARGRLGGRISLGDFSGLLVDLGVSFVHKPLSHNTIDALLLQMHHSTVPAQMYFLEEYYKGGHELNSDEYVKAGDLNREFQIFTQGYLQTLNYSLCLQGCRKVFYQRKQDEFSAQVLARTYFELLMKGMLDGPTWRRLGPATASRAARTGLTTTSPPAATSSCCSTSSSGAAAWAL